MNTEQWDGTRTFHTAAAAAAAHRGLHTEQRRHRKNWYNDMVNTKMKKKKEKWKWNKKNEVKNKGEKSLESELIPISSHCALQVKFFFFLLYCSLNQRI